MQMSTQSKQRQITISLHLVQDSNIIAMKCNILKCTIPGACLQSFFPSCGWERLRILPPKTESTLTELFLNFWEKLFSNFFNRFLKQKTIFQDFAILFPKSNVKILSVSKRTKFFCVRKKKDKVAQLFQTVTKGNAIQDKAF